MLELVCVFWGHNKTASRELKLTADCAEILGTSTQQFYCAQRMSLGS